MATGTTKIDYTGINTNFVVIKLYIIVGKKITTTKKTQIKLIKF